ncbi:MFS transporter [Vulcanococcus sp.]|jgi:putative MFS transporter|uniref:MFS transporter n=1 Tax=Vulcanococcus sp. TaxID=2856995 RepID=UPI003C100F1B
MAPEPRFVQDYIDEGPHGSLSSMQWLLWLLASAGKFFEGLVVFIGGLALPLVQEDFALNASERGLLTAMPLLGILLGALLLGGLADRWGRKPVFIAEMVLLVLGLLGAALSPNAVCLLLCLLLVGLALGADYPTAHLVISESIPSALRGRLVLGAFSFQALGALAATALGAVVLLMSPDLQAWRSFYLFPVLPVALVAWGRLFLPESSHWLAAQGDVGLAEQQLARLLNRPDVALARMERQGFEPSAQGPSWRSLFQGRLLRATVLSSVPWFLQDISTYGIGIFTPMIVASLFGSKAGGHNLAAVIHDDLLGARGAALVDLAFVAGIAVAIALADRWGRIPLQILGFVGCALGLSLAALGSGDSPWGENLPLLMAGFVLFQFMTNVGPNSQTYLLAGEVFPVPLRGLGAGLAAAAGKVGAVLTAFLFPILLAQWGSQRLLPLLVLCSLVGALVTWHYRIETKGADLS